MRRPANPTAQRLLLVLVTLTICAVSMIVAGPRGSYDTLISVFLGMTWFAVLIWLLGFNWLAILGPGRFRVISIITCLAGVACTVLSGLAAPALALKWRGEREAVTVVSKYTETSYRSTRVTGYSYQLMTSTGQIVRPDPHDSSGQFQVGDHLWATTDPWGLIEPVFDDEVSELPVELIALAISIVAALAGGFVLLRFVSADTDVNPRADAGRE